MMRLIAGSVSFRLLIVLLCLVFGGSVAAGVLSAQSNTVASPTVVTDAMVGSVPFGRGEIAEYQVRLGRASVGSGSMEVLGIETVDGRQTYRTRLQVAGGLPLMRVDNNFESWIDVNRLFSRRFHQNQRELNFRRNRVYDFFPESRSYRRQDNGEVGALPTDRPLDEVSFLYFVRTLPLRVGDTYQLDQYYKESGNPVVLHVVRRETITVPAGTFNTIVVRPVIKTSGLFGEGGEAEVYFSDDERRIPVMLRSRVPLVGHLNLFLRSYTPGEPAVMRATPASARR
jgi:hypothetical protein